MRGFYRGVAAPPISYECGPNLTGIPQARSNPVDGNMDTAPHALVALAGAVAAYQFDLEVVQRVDVGEAVVDGALQAGVGGQALFVASDQGEGVGGAMPFLLDRTKYFAA